MKGSRKKRRRGAPVPTFTIACHPQSHRVGERLRMPELEFGKTLAVNRLEPSFTDARGNATAPLSDSFVSRSPLQVSADAKSITLRTGGVFDVRVDGEAARGPITIDRDRLADGVTVTLSNRVILVLHWTQGRPKRTPAHGLVGFSDSIADVRREIGRVAETDLQVLLRGESGTGKELVARALHQASGRAKGPYVTVNMAAIPSTVAASELFGHVKGAFTGAAHARAGLFQQADGGTLFLDEVGETPSDVQPLLLRALESGEVQRVGDERRTRVDVRVIAATDADLEKAVADGSFRLALLHRLEAYVVELPPLRERREDIGLLLVHFLRGALSDLGHQPDELLETPHGEDAWLEPELVEPLLRYGWPGNVRQLFNVARQLAVANADAEVAEMTRALARMLPERPEAAQDAAAAKVAASTRTDLDNVDDQRLLEVLRANHFRVGASAAQLGMSKNSLYRLIERNPLIRKAGTLTAEEIAAARDAVGDDATMMADYLEVSKHGLLLRIRALSQGE